MEKHQPVQTHMIIGLTGNIGSGKSSVRKMLERIGALGIDADRVAKDALKKDSPAFPRVRNLFGDDILDKQGEIDRKKLGAIVFQDPVRLKQLEEISHPLVSGACKNIIANSPLPIIVIEAIKLLESDLAPLCQSIWVVETPLDAVYQRLEQSRGMSRADVDARLAKQSSVAEKKRRADVVIDNSASSQNTWQQVQSAIVSSMGTDSLFDITQNQPIISNLLQPSNTNIQKLRTILQRYPFSLLNRIIAARVTGQVDQAQLKEWYKDDELVFRSLFQFNFSQTEKVELACWEQDHFSCTMGGRIQIDMGDLEDLRILLDCFENFGSRRLCRRFSIPIKKEEASFVEELGYVRQQEHIFFDEVYRKAGYNLYTKVNPLSFKLFKVC